MRTRLATWLLAGSTASALLLAGCQAGTEPASQAPAATTNAAPGAGPPAGAAFTSPAAQEEAAAARSEIVGHAAPDFSLPDQDGQRVRLSALRGQWVVVYFYPKDDTPGCTTEATEFTGLMAGGFRPRGARVLGISADPVESHRAFRAKFELGVDLLSDPDHEVMAAYGAWAPSSPADQRHGRVVRSTLLIDPRGVIRYHWPEVIPQGHAERVQQKLAELQARAQ